MRNNFFILKQIKFEINVLKREEYYNLILVQLKFKAPSPSGLASVISSAVH